MCILNKTSFIHPFINHALLNKALLTKRKNKASKHANTHTHTHALSLSLSLSVPLPHFFLLTLLSHSATRPISLGPFTAFEVFSGAVLSFPVKLQVHCDRNLVSVTRDTHFITPQTTCSSRFDVAARVWTVPAAADYAVNIAPLVIYDRGPYCPCTLSGRLMSCGSRLANSASLFPHP